MTGLSITQLIIVYIALIHKSGFYMLQEKRKKA